MADANKFNIDGTTVNIEDSTARTPTFSEASTRANIASGENLPTLFGKIKKYFTDLKAVAFSGSYNDLTDKPTIPTVNNATLTIQKNGTNVQTFTANASANKTANITVPTKVSELTNDSGYTTNTGTVTQVKVGTTAYNPSSGVVSLPAYPTDTNTHRPIQVNGTEILGNNTTALNLKAGSNVSITNSSGTVTIAATDTTYSSKAAASGGTDVSLVTTGEKYTWNNKQSALSRQTGSLTAASGITLSNVRCEKYGKVVSVLAYCGGSVAANGTLFTLPSGFRPPTKTYSIAVATVSGALANPYVEVNTNGIVKALNAGSNYGVEMTFIIS